MQLSIGLFSASVEPQTSTSLLDSVFNGLSGLVLAVIGFLLVTDYEGFATEITAMSKASSRPLSKIAPWGRWASRQPSEDVTRFGVIVARIGGGFMLLSSVPVILLSVAGAIDHAAP